ncbi:XRN 5'-3' exonuclease N-terminus-domain-containing protein [Xylariales sp. AK1849]|nr:XRN 5'-3' exonuclease N-terminus-domain-containing protein [Xylariales sp. AK1849]
MGVPKFFRWLSERYPAISQLIAENRIPEFDNLYLDMNGIIHNCTHKDTHDTTFRLSEKEMFIRIFAYIEHLFGKIKPKKLFFMAIDGVAPRAKMNQQRARRFRTALDAEQAREKAIREGIEQPKEDPFDSNCITPGTEFMANLTQQLKYFIAKKITEDKDWQGCDVVLSGHEVPGEGEHKIMEYIRNAKAQPDYDPNVRHCLYGLDADLIMLGLLSHDPHFCLLREEVTFGRASKTKSKELEHQNFYLMHLCIVREYLELEFQDLKKEGVLQFPFDMERVIDDFILMAFFVGNDFLPNLPYLHINEGALATMFRLYKQVLPQGDGYINEGGVINLPRLGLLLEDLSKEETRHFEHENSDQKWLRSKQSAEANGDTAAPKTKGKMVMTSPQKELWKKIRKYVQKRPPGVLDLGTQLVAADRKFVQDTAESLHVEWRTTEDDDGQRHLVLSIPAKAAGGGENDEDEEEEEGHLAVLRVMKRYDNAQVVDVSPDEAQASMQIKYKEKFLEWKNKYYEGKFPEWTPESKETELRLLSENYVQGLQWVLYYYYRGVASWPWFYGYHYSPMTSDVSRGFNADLNFKLGQPFHPYEQLMGVLPDRSKKIVPTVYHPLMTDPSSSVIDFYPRDFELDMNGKKMEWEAVVKIPFIDEKRLLSAMAPKNELLSPEEKARNDFGVSLKFTYDQNTNFVYPSSMVGEFPDIINCKCIENIYDLPVADGLELYRGLMDGAKLNIEALAGFPSLATLAYNAALGFHGVKVFNQESRNESMVVTVSDVDLRNRVESAKVKLGQSCFVGYPFLQEAKVVRVSDELFDHVLAGDGSGQVLTRNHSGKEIDDWNGKAERIEAFYSSRLGIIIGSVESMIHVEPLRGLIKMDDGALVKEFGPIPGMETDYAAQVIVDEVMSQDERFIERAALPIEEEFPIGSRAFYLASARPDEAFEKVLPPKPKDPNHPNGAKDRVFFPVYGRPVEITGHNGNRAVVKTSLYFMKPNLDPSKQETKDLAKQLANFVKNEPHFAKPIIQAADRTNRYWPSYTLAKHLDFHPLALSKITASFFVQTTGGLRVNLGLNLKFEARKLKVLGYSRKSNTGWEFSPRAVTLIAEYVAAFPDFFHAIKQKPQGNELNETDIFPDPTYASQRVKEMGAWIKEHETNSFEKVPLEAEQLDSDVVEQLEKAAADLNAPEPIIRGFGNVPRNALLRPEDAEQRLGNQTFSLGDRVVYAQGSGKVPIGLKGTIIGISTVGSNHMLDVVFDTPFMSGTTLSERCTPFQGGTVPANAVLNTTNHQLLALTSEQTKKSLESKTNSTPLSVSQGSGSYGGTYGHAYRDAPAPAPLQGSWRGALNGGNRGYSGRGGSNHSNGNGIPHLQSASMVYRPAPNGHISQGGYGPQQQMDGAPRRGRGGQYRGDRGGFPSRGGRGDYTTAGQSQVQANDQMSSNPHLNNHIAISSAYNAVPPPPNLDARGRGRGRGGRGGGRGQRGTRGGPFRGRGGPAQEQTA